MYVFLVFLWFFAFQAELFAIENDVIWMESFDYK